MYGKKAARVPYVKAFILYTYKPRKRVSNSIYQMYTIWWAYSFLSFISSCTDNLKTRKAAWKLIYDCMLLSYHVRVLEWIYTRQLPEYQGTHCWKSPQSLSVSNGIQNLVKWFIYELSGCWFESRYCHTINMKKN